MNKPTTTTCLLPFIIFFLQRSYLYCAPISLVLLLQLPSTHQFASVLIAFFLSFPSRLSLSLVFFSLILVCTLHHICPYLISFCYLLSCTRISLSSSSLSCPVSYPTHSCLYYIYHMPISLVFLLSAFSLVFPSRLAPSHVLPLTPPILVCTLYIVCPNPLFLYLFCLLSLLRPTPLHKK
jgi:hypothetical protein